MTVLRPDGERKGVRERRGRVWEEIGWRVSSPWGSRPPHTDFRSSYACHSSV